MSEPDHYDLWMQAGGHPGLYRRLSIQATEQDPLPDLPHQPGDDHCGVGGRPRPGHPEYRRCSCGRWYFWTTSRWVPGRPSAHWLREHGLDPEEFWDMPGDSGPACSRTSPSAGPPSSCSCAGYSAARLSP